MKARMFLLCSAFAAIATTIADTKPEVAEEAPTIFDDDATFRVTASTELEDDQEQLVTTPEDDDFDASAKDGDEDDFDDDLDEDEDLSETDAE